MRAPALLLVLAACGRIDFDVHVASDGATGDSGDGPAGVVQVTPMAAIRAPSAQVTFPAAPVSGDLVVAAAWCWGGNGCALDASAVSDDAGMTYAQARVIATTINECTNGQGVAAIYYLRQVGVGSPTLTITPTGAMPEIGLVAIEYRGFSVLDTSSSRETPGTATPVVFDTGPVTTTSPTALLVSVANTCNGSPDTVTWTETSGFTTRAHQDTTTLQPGYVGDKLVGPGTYSDAWSVAYVIGPPYPSIAALAAFR